MFPNKKATMGAFVVVLSLIVASGRVECWLPSHPQVAEGRNASILVFGPSGSEVSSTVRMLLGRFSPPKKVETDSSNSSTVKSVITEFVVPIPGEFGSFLRIVEIEGVTDSPEEDAYAQASLKTFLTHPEGLNSQRPTAVLVVSPFDDFRYDDPQSSFVEMLRRIADVEKSVYGNGIPDINILLFTRPMNVKSTERSPKKKLESLKSAATFYVPGISPNIATLVGTNVSGDSGVTLNETGTNRLYRIPNRQYHPANVFEAIANLAGSNGVPSEKDIVEIFATIRLNPNREHNNFRATRVPFTVAPDSADVDIFTLSILRSGLGDVDESEVNAALQATYENLTDASLKRRIASSVPRLQRFFQSVNIRRLSDLPSTRLDSSKLFHSLPTAVNKDVVSFLREALNLTAPTFIESLTVGRGYDLLRDEVLTAASVPFASAAMDRWEYSSWGHLLPTFVSCLQLPYNQVQFYIHFADTLDQSVVQRQAYLQYPNKDALNISNFNKQLRMGFNVKTDVSALSAVKEFRTHKMQLNEKAELSEEFRDSVRLLTPFDATNQNSAGEWRSFFERWGTHVVSAGFLGGLIHATPFIDIQAAYQNTSKTRSILEGIFNVTRVSENRNGVTFFSFPPGDSNYNPMIYYLYDLHPEAERNELVENWESRLSYRPLALNYQMELIPMSSLIGRVNETMSQPAATALDLLLRGNLVYKRRS